MVVIFGSYMPTIPDWPALAYGTKVQLLVALA
jgi:hypothetical protein